MTDRGSVITFGAIALTAVVAAVATYVAGAAPAYMSLLGWIGAWLMAAWLAVTAVSIVLTVIAAFWLHLWKYPRERRRDSDVVRPSKR